jgi:CRISPR/Cas system-associated protein Cas5 (RAMP superfamily)
VAYTLVRNSSIQQYTAKNLELLKERHSTKRVFSLESTIRGKEEEERRKSLVEDVSFGDSCKKEGSIEELAPVIEEIYRKEDGLISDSTFDPRDGKGGHHAKQESEAGYFL